MNKKIIIIAVVGILVLILALMIIFSYLSKQETAIQQIQTPPSSAQPQAPTQIQPSYPVNPETGNQNGSSLSAIVKNINSEAVSEATKKQGIKWIRPQDKNGNTIALDDFAKAVGLAVNPNIRNILNDKNYDVFYCPFNGSEKDMGMDFNARLFQSYPKLYPDMVSWMRQWEKTMFRDTHTVLFPEVTFSEASLGQELKFQDGKYRSAEVLLPDGQKRSINYTIVGDTVIITTYPKCLDTAVAAIEPVEP